jgi:hypothetical protein
VPRTATERASGLEWVELHGHRVAYPCPGSGTLIVLDLKNNAWILRNLTVGNPQVSVSGR